MNTFQEFVLKEIQAQGFISPPPLTELNPLQTISVGLNMIRQPKPDDGDIVDHIRWLINQLELIYSVACNMNVDVEYWLQKYMEHKYKENMNAIMTELILERQAQARGAFN